MKTLITSIKFTLVFCALLFGGYVLILWGFSIIASPSHGEAELVMINGKPVGAKNVGQHFSQNQYFWGRPSAVDYNGSGSGGSNKGPSNKAYLNEVEERIDAFMHSHPYLKRKDIPAELVTASGSGLDPHISLYAAEIQIKRVAEARKLPFNIVSKILESQIHRPFFGHPYVNVLCLDVAMDNYVSQR